MLASFLRYSSFTTFLDALISYFCCLYETFSISPRLVTIPLVIWSGCDWRGLSKYTGTKAISKNRDKRNQHPNTPWGRKRLTTTHNGANTVRRKQSFEAPARGWL